MAYKQPKNTPIHNDGASAVGIIAGIGAGIAKLATAAKAAKVAKLAATAAKAAKAAKAGKTVATAAKAAKTAKAAKLAAKSTKLAKAGKTGKAARVLKRSGKVADKAKAIGEKATNKALNAGKKMEGKLMKQVDRQMGRSLKSGEKELAKAAKSQAKADGTYSPIKDAIGKAKDGINKGFDKASDITGQSADDLKAKALQLGINQTSNLVQKQKAKNQSSLTKEDFHQSLGVTEEEPQIVQQSYQPEDKSSSYSNPTGASMVNKKSNTTVPKGYLSSPPENQKAPSTNYQRFFQNLANNSVNANIGGVKVNVGHLGLIAGHLIGKGVDAVKTKKRLNGIKKQDKIKNESAARAKEEVANKKIMQDIDNIENNIANKTFNKK